MNETQQKKPSRRLTLDERIEKARQEKVVADKKYYDAQNEKKAIEKKVRSHELCVLAGAVVEVASKSEKHRKAIVDILVKATKKTGDMEVFEKWAKKFSESVPEAPINDVQ